MSRLQTRPIPPRRTSALESSDGGLAVHVRRPVNWRSVLLGLSCAVFICALAPYNDYVLDNTFLVGNYLPIGLLLFFSMFLMLVNGPLSRWAPRYALSSGELAVALGMGLVACAVPTSGLMRYLPTGLATSWYHAGQNTDYRRLLEELNLPNWLFPAFRSDSVADRAADPLVQDWWGRQYVEDPSFIGRLKATPFAAWAVPAVTWGSLVFALWGAILCMAVIVRRQWVENERLAFPLASVYLSVIETPTPGRALNGLFSSRVFWIAFSIVFAIHGANALYQYDPKHFPEIPVNFDLTSILAERPWSYAELHLKQSNLFFSIVGLTFFLQTKVAFSLWFFFLAYQAARMVYGTYEAEFTGGRQQDQQLGAAVAFAIMILWIGRHHWLLVLRHMFGRAGRDEPHGRYMPYVVAGWGFVGCAAFMVGWLCIAGTTLFGGIVIVTLLLLMMLVLARVVAETGLMYIQVTVPLHRPWIYMLNELPEALAHRTTLRNHFFATWFNQAFGHDTRESLSPFATHAMRVADEAAYPRESGWRRAIAFTACLALALVVAYVVAGASMLYVEYAHGTTLDAKQAAPINPWGADGSVKWQMLQPSVDYMPPRTGPSEVHSRLGHFAFGGLFTGLLSVLRLRYTNWQLHPVGFLLAYVWPLKRIWVSILAGWLCKVLIVRFGGIDLFRSARLFFIGMILGEAGAAAFWLVVGIVLNALGYQFYAIRLLPE